MKHFRKLVFVLLVNNCLMVFRSFFVWASIDFNLILFIYLREVGHPSLFKSVLSKIFNRKSLSPLICRGDFKFFMLLNYCMFFYLCYICSQKCRFLNFHALLLFSSINIWLLFSSSNLYWIKFDLFRTHTFF